MSAPAHPRAPSNWLWRDGPVRGEAVVFDLDGVLADAAGRQHFLQWPGRDWQAFFEAVGDDPVIEEVSTLLHALDERFTVVLLTARPLTVQRQTHDWLVRNDLRWDLLVMRKTGDYDLASEFKAGTVDQLRTAGLEPTLAFEDDQRNVAMFRGRDIPCVYIHSGYYD
jgi:hypothetical protein